ncbi:cache domain-containing protein [Pelagibius marinus]|uniref:cache domain-containing protein n=1 Tax=Pelagibius marinus TaxID=2762760 RepID=UPI002AC34455|nr:cache domain-containing protein [Pelagibius marinus]
MLATLPLIVAIVVVTLLVMRGAKDLSEQEIAVFEANMLAAKQAELQNYVSLALTSIRHIYDAAGPNDTAAQDAVRQILNGMTYGPDGYFFVYDYSGVNIVHPKQEFRVGKNWWDLEDRTGNKVIQGLIKQAQAGGGYHRYQWEKPSSGAIADKIGYAVALDKWQWMLGTGLYIDDVVAQAAAIRSDVEEGIEDTFLIVALATVPAVLLVFLTGVAINIHERRLADTKLKALTQRIVDIQEEERARVARELHDGISQILVSARYVLESVLHRAKDGDGESLLSTLETCEGRLSHAIREIRRISRDLRPQILDDLGLSPALKSLVTEFSERTGIEVDIKTVAFKDLLSAEVKTALYRIAQEALTNIERHAQASKVVLRLESLPTGIVLRIADDGIGNGSSGLRRSRDSAQGFGLRNMQERIEHFDGHIWMEFSDRGAVIEAHLPKSVLQAQTERLKVEAKNEPKSADHGYVGGRPPAGAGGDPRLS